MKWGIDSLVSLSGWTRTQASVKWTPPYKHHWPCLWRSGAQNLHLLKGSSISCLPWSCTAASPSAVATTPPTSACLIWKRWSSGRRTKKKPKWRRARKKVKSKHRRMEIRTTTMEKCLLAWRPGARGVRAWLTQSQGTKSYRRVVLDFWEDRRVCPVSSWPTAANKQKKQPVVERQRDQSEERPQTAPGWTLTVDLRRSRRLQRSLQWRPQEDWRQQISSLWIISSSMRVNGCFSMTPRCVYLRRRTSCKPVRPRRAPRRHRICSSTERCLDVDSETSRCLGRSSPSWQLHLQCLVPKHLWPS